MPVSGKSWQGKLTVGGTDLSTRVKSIAANLAKAQLDRGVMGNESVSFGHGLEQDTLQVTLYADRSATAGAGDITVNKIFRDMLVNETAVTVVYQAISGSPTDGNPTYTWTSGMSIYQLPENITHGQDEMVNVTLVANVTATIATS